MALTHSSVGLDYLAFPNGPIEQSQRLASTAFEAKQTWFLVNGTTGGIHAAIMASCRPGDCLLLARNCHQSAFAAAAFSGKHVHRNPCGQEAAQCCPTCALLFSTLHAASMSKAILVFAKVRPSTCCGVCQDVTHPTSSQNAIPSWELHMECALTRYNRHWKLL